MMLIFLLLLIMVPVDARAEEGAAASLPVEGRYLLRGNPDLLPVALSDDGQKTYIEWAQDQALPAVFAVNRRGREEMIDGYMRNGIFTIDRVYSQLKFRIDKLESTASRVEARAKP